MTKNEKEAEIQTLEEEEEDEDLELKKYEENKKKLKEKARKQIGKQSYKSLVEEKISRMEYEALSTQALGNMVLVHNNSQGYIETVQVTDDSRLVHPESGNDVAIFDGSDAITVYMDMRNYWIIGGIIQKLKFWIVLFWLRILGMDYIGRLKFNLYRIEARGEYTLSWQDLTPNEYKRRVEEYLKIANPSDQGKALAKMAEGLSDPAKWWVNGMWLITILLIIFMFLYVMNGGGV
jgi:hypothetical protein